MTGDSEGQGYNGGMKNTLIDEAFAHWSMGNPLAAGLLIYEQIPNEQRPRWAAQILAECLPLIPNVPEISEVYEIAGAPLRWAEAYAAFSDVRQRTLEAERTHSTDLIYKSVLSVAENAAKVTYNASGQPAPFDYEAGARLVRDLRCVVDEVNRPEFESKAWAVVISAS